nr:proteasome subunit alpha type-5 [Tanacetum cinerariifolium]
MFLTRTEYDRGVNTFSPEGRLFQVEYAIEAIKTKEGVVLAVEKRITSPLLVFLFTNMSMLLSILVARDPTSAKGHVACLDARTLLEHARVETQNHRFSYGESMTVESTTHALCDLALRFGEGEEEPMGLTTMGKTSSRNDVKKHADRKFDKKLEFYSKVRETVALGSQKAIKKVSLLVS